MSKTPPPRKGWITPFRIAAFIVGCVVGSLLAQAVLPATGTHDLANDPAKSPAQIVVHVDGPKGAPAPVTVPAPAVVTAAQGLADHADGSGATKPPGVSDAEWAKGVAQRAAEKKADPLPTSFPLASVNQPGCTTRQISTNYSSRNGVRPKLLVTHYTVSPNRPGWSDVFAIVAWFNGGGAQASSNYVVDSEGHCAYMVPETLKAWAQVGFNSLAISVEMVNTGKEKTLAAAAGMRKLGEIWSDAGKRWGIPLRRGIISGCTVVRSGIVDHNQLGACGGGHFDITPFSVDTVIAAAKAYRASTAAAALTAAKAKVCASLKYHRAKARRLKADSPAHAAQIARVITLKKKARAIGLDPNIAACKA